MVQYRPFHNSDPPKLVALWHAARLGKGAAAGFMTDAFEIVVLAQPYFEREGMIVACEGSQVIGFAHAGFGVNDSQSALARERGVICAAIVHPEHRRKGIGRELVTRAENYLRASGAQQITAGPAAPNDPFYIGLYGGARPSGFLESDENAGPFFTALGYQPADRHLVMQRDLSQSGDPTSFRLVTIRRKMQLAIGERPQTHSWWWVTRFGRLDTLQFELVPKSNGAPVAVITAVGLDFYFPKWGERAVGLIDLDVYGTERSKGYGQTVVVEVCRRLKSELITRAEVHVPETNAGAGAVFRSSGFSQVDTGIVYARP